MRHQISHGWHTLDTIAKIFPAVARKSYSTFFRIEVGLKESVVVEALYDALKDTLNCYPLFQVHLHQGLFWFFLDDCIHDPVLEPIASLEPCRYQTLAEKKIPLWRVLCGTNRIALEVSHIITDGIGAKEFFCTLLCRYYEYLYEPIDDWGTVRHITCVSSSQEYQHDYRKHYVPHLPRSSKLRNAFRYPELRGSKYKLLRMFISTSYARKKAQEYNVTVTELFIILHMYIIKVLYGNILKKKKGLVQDLVLVNLRPFFNSVTLCNFYHYVMPYIDFALGDYSFDEIVVKVHHSMRAMLDVHEIRRGISEHVALENALLNKMIPSIIKNIVLRLAQRHGEKSITSSISNLGRVVLPKQLNTIVKNIALFPTPSQIAGRNIAIISYQDEMCIGIGKYIDDANVDRTLARTLIDMGFEVTYLEW